MRNPRSNRDERSFRESHISLHPADTLLTNALQFAAISMSFDHEVQVTNLRFSSRSPTPSIPVSGSNTSDGSTAPGGSTDKDTTMEVINQSVEFPSPEWEQWMNIAEIEARRYGMKDFQANLIWATVCKVMDEITDSHDALWVCDYEERLEMGYYLLLRDAFGGLYNARVMWTYNPGRKSWKEGRDRALKPRKALDLIWGIDGITYPSEANDIVKAHWTKIQRYWPSIRPKLVAIESALEHEERSLTSTSAQSGI